MKFTVPLMILLVASWGSAAAQITIEQDDMPSSGDTIRVSQTIHVPVDYTLTGTDTAWDFSMLEAMNQRLDTFVSMNAVPLVYRLVFIPDFVANLASPRTSNLALPGLAVSQSYVFYKKNALGFSEAGYAFTAGGLPVPLKYDVPDLYYAFPMTYGSTWNSSSHAQLAMTGLAYIGSTRVRSSIVDGWGTLTTPFGTFETLRIRTVLQESDSIYIDSLGVGIPMNRQITLYTWLGKQQGEPLLQVSEEAGTAIAIYRDLFREQALPISVSLGGDTAVQKGHTITLTPVITGGTPPFRYIWSTFDTSASITLTVDTLMHVGVVVFDAFDNVGADMITISVKNPPGIQVRHPRPLQIRPNPSDGRFAVGIPDPDAEGVLVVYTAAGLPVWTGVTAPHGPDAILCLQSLPAGLYVVVVKQKDILATGRVIIRHK
jgi:hypothetical protein